MKISQREARRNRAELKALQRRMDLLRRGWINEWPADTQACILVANKGEYIDDSDLAILRTARACGHPVVAVQAGNSIEFFAIK